MKDLSIYIHIPFCARKCLYCDFLSAPAAPVAVEEYTAALCAEIAGCADKYKDYRVRTVFFGGGTPSLLSGGQMERIMEAVRKNYLLKEEAEISMESNPGTVSREKLQSYKDAGINRISIGLQSAQDRELRILGRIHTYGEFLAAYDLCRDVGLHNINIDLMYALPGQSLDSYRDTLEKAAALEPRHISAYSLILEEGTPFYRQYVRDEEREWEMDRLTRLFLREKGYARYEISNYARPGWECAHNCVYWSRGDYAGFGLGAASLVRNTRWKNTASLTAYLSAPPNGKREPALRLSEREQMEETMFLGLRMKRGVSKKRFRELFHKEMDEVYGEVLSRHEQNGLLINEERVRLTERGVEVGNYVFADFLF